ncbi:MAG: hypothetical protein KatS3mg059_0967 [Thermomicrobiales bacterium]|nr:MAG: hypothetical protein KatS3mg059_0967 [Thermomicrobiales bacterium]
MGITSFTLRGLLLLPREAVKVQSAAQGRNTILDRLAHLTMAVEDVNDAHRRWAFMHDALPAH